MIKTTKNSAATYLGHTIHSSLSDDPHIQARMSKANQVFGALRHHLFCNKHVWRKVKAEVLLAMVVPTLLDGAECCAVTAATMQDMETMYLKWVRSCLGVTPWTQRKYRMTSESLLKRLGVNPLHHYLDLKTLSYAGHVERMMPGRLPRITRHSQLEGARRRGRPNKSGEDGIKDSLRRKGVSVSTWQIISQNRTKWAKSYEILGQKL